MLENIRIISILLHPFIPESCDKIRERLGLEGEILFENVKWGILKPGTEVKKGEILFEKIKD